MRGAKSAKWVAIAAVVALGATACGGGGDKGGDSKAAIDPDGKFSVEVGEPQNPLQPANTMESNGSIVIKSLFSGLVDYDSSGKIVMVNAQSIDTKDNKTFTVKLKPGWKFHDGTPVTATSYVKAWNWAANPENKQTNSAWFADIQGYDDVAPPAKGKAKTDKMSGLKVVDDNTFTITLSKPIPYYVYKLGYESSTRCPSPSTRTRRPPASTRSATAPPTSSSAGTTSSRSRSPSSTATRPPTPPRTAV